jgi:serine phosphatase RsbU (regulator of sigma subunit)
LNCRLREYAVPGLFLAAVLVGVDYASGRVEVWNGGMPAGLWLRAGRPLAPEALAPRHLPLGVLAADQFDSACVELGASEGHLMFCSDGLIEAAGPGGEPFGLERLHQHLRHPEAGAAVRGALDALAAHRAGLPAHDDISWMMIALDPAHGSME